ncbi:MAG: DUF4176 domain-containing protein [Bacteroides sp.]|nr:DUF4176 domain-containing protein [Bacteroides sp.]MCM1550438.1 DUF4176 domain-containing protein [Clostridium sp.]
MEQNHNNEALSFYPVGSVVIVKGNVRKMIVLARCVMTEIQGTLHFFDYAGALYPEGLVNSQMIYFNHKDISRIIFEGYSDEDEVMMKENLNDWIEKTNIKRGNPYDLNVKNMMEQINQKKERD